jgi:hypothetical protein
VNGSGHNHQHFARVEAEREFHSAKGTSQKQQRPTADIFFLSQIGQLAVAIGDFILDYVAVQHTDLVPSLLPNPVMVHD